MIQKILHLVSWILNFVGSPLFQGLNNRIIEFQRVYASIKWFLQHRSFNQMEANDSPTHSLEEWMTVDDIHLVVEKLGMGNFSENIEMPGDGKYRECGILEGVSNLLEKKEASLEELKKAFAVFDRNRDGFIGVMELQEVMCRLDFHEGMKLEDCEKMIKAVDENGDGRIDFFEFKNMLENVR